MTKHSPLDILKNALLLERRGKAFYAKVAEQATAPAVKKFFAWMAEEEDHHIEILSEQYRAYRDGGRFAATAEGDTRVEGFSSSVLSDRLKKEMAAAGFEAAAVAAAMAMERNAVRLYGERAEQAEDPQERDLYRWLAEWERGHLDLLVRVDRDLTEAVWNDNHFWPL